jgi:2-dehydrotetronate isomerase
MPRFAANLTMMYGEYPFPDRFAAAAKDGFKAVECLFPYEYPANDLATWLRDHGLIQVLLNAPPGNFAAGERPCQAKKPSFVLEYTPLLNMRRRWPVRGCM